MTTSRHPVRWLVPRLALAVLMGLGIALVVDVVRAGGPGPWLAQHRLPPPYVARGTVVDIGGRSLYLDCRGAGSPTVVLESGMGDGAGAWAAVQDELAASTRTCAYDRAGRGSSDPRGRHTLADAAADLRTLLEAAGEAGPFVVVGHSLGGDHVRLFADRYRDETVALVLVDAFNPDLEAAHVHPLLGDLRPEYEARLDGLRSIVASVEDLDWTASETQLRAASLDGLPIDVLRAPRHEPRLDEATNAAVEAAWVAAYEGLSPGNVRYELAWGAGHVIQVDRPDLVIATIRRIIDEVRP
jgi:pimeloyl-ACP methyl ester carboxylesterase